MERLYRNQTRIKNDICKKKSELKNNRKIRNYVLPPNIHSVNARTDYLNSVSQDVGIYQQYNTNFRPINVDSGLKHGETGNITNRTKTRNLLLHNYITPPYSVATTNQKYDPDSDSQLIMSEMTKDKYDNMRGKTIDTFIPLLPNIKKDIENVDHYVPKYWVNGGQDTRAVIRNIDYIAHCKANIVMEE